MAPLYHGTNLTGGLVGGLSPADPVLPPDPVLLPDLPPAPGLPPDFPPVFAVAGLLAAGGLGILSSEAPTRFSASGTNSLGWVLKPERRNSTVIGVALRGNRCWNGVLPRTLPSVTTSAPAGSESKSIPTSAGSDAAGASAGSVVGALLAMGSGGRTVRSEADRVPLASSDEENAPLAMRTAAPLSATPTMPRMIHGRPRRTSDIV